MQPKHPLPQDDSGNNGAVIDQLIQDALAYHTPGRLKELLDFTRRLPAYSPFNCLLLHIQRPDATYVARAAKWEKLQRTLKPGARPLLILAPMHPVMFVFDIADTEGPPLPPGAQQVLKTGFAVVGEVPGPVRKRLLHQCHRCHVLVDVCPLGAGLAGTIAPILGGFKVRLNALHTQTQQFATLVHELGHLFCGHLGPVSQHGGPDQRGQLSYSTREIEAEAVAWLVCQRVGIWPASACYLADYLKDSADLPPYSLEAILVAAGAVEQMTKGRRPRWLSEKK